MKNNKFSILSIVIGLIGLLLFPFIYFLGIGFLIILVVGVIGLLLAIKGIRKNENKVYTIISTIIALADISIGICIIFIAFLVFRILTPFFE